MVMSVVMSGSVINIVTSGAGNAVINAADGEPFELFTGAGELRFDMHIKLPVLRHLVIF